MKEQWLIWNDTEHPPQENMDIDSCLLKKSAELNNSPLLRIYKWDRPAISIGYVQKEEIINEKNYTIIKRPTGGGVVYHDTGLTYTVVIPSTHRIANLDRVESYRVIHKAVVRAFASFGLQGILVDSAEGHVDRATMRCFTTPTRYDVLCLNPNEKNPQATKYAGSAQRRTKNGILHQGSIVLKATNGDWDKLANALKKGFIQEFDIVFEEFQLDLKALLK